MNTEQIPLLKDVYRMQPDDVGRFADTLADGFSQYALFQHICDGKYDRDKMCLFWTLTLALLPDNAICMADSKEANSVLIYIRPQSKEASLFSYIKEGGLKMLLKFGIKGIVRLMRFEATTKRIAKRHQTSNDGYLMAFATRLDKQGQHYGKPLMEALLSHLDATGEGCYLETLKAENVGLYEHFSFELKEHINMHLGNLPLYAMHRPGGKLLHFR
jgi:GNAT superfamily N-acetyltransferase